MPSKITVVAVVEPPTRDDDHWIVSAPAINYFVQGDTKREALKLFEEGLFLATQWAKESGINVAKAKQPEVVAYECEVA